MDKLHNTSYYTCKYCNMIIRKSNKSRHERSNHHILAEAIVNDRQKMVSSIEYILNNTVKSKKHDSYDTATPRSLTDDTTSSGIPSTSESYIYIYIRAN